MNYRKIYIKLMKRAEQRLEVKIFEKHHIFPKSIFGNNKRIVKLTLREHYVSHHLLWKDYQKRYGNNHWKTQKMLKAFWVIAHINNIKLSSRTFEIVRENFKIEQGKKSKEFWKDIEYIKKQKDERKSRWITTDARKIASQRMNHRKKAVERIDPNTGEIKEYDGVRNTRIDGYTTSGVSAACKGKKYCEKYRGYYWKFKD